MKDVQNEKIQIEQEHEKRRDQKSLWKQKKGLENCNILTINNIIPIMPVVSF